ncbi:MAG: hypothetical protein QNK04_17010 [Myxococcota bacterium]|nr:hypothetical protein [Myxococcota bacterium]
MSVRFSPPAPQPRGSSLLLLTALFVCSLAPGPAWAQIFGLKACGATFGLCQNPVASEPPTRLFRFEEDGSSLASIGPLEVDGTPVAGDGLALSPDLGLLGYELVGPVPAPVDGSQLLSIDPVTADATPIGAVLDGRSIRGAVFDEADRLWVLDAENDELLEIDPTDGSVIGTPIAVTMPGGGPFDVTSASDLAMRGPGDFVMVDANAFYALDPTTGVVTLLFLDTMSDNENPNSPFFAGLAASSDGIRLFGFDVNGAEDIFEYSEGFARAEIYSDLVSSFNAGRGDLANAYPRAAVPASGPAALLALVAASLGVGVWVLRGAPRQYTSSRCRRQPSGQMTSWKLR